MVNQRPISVLHFTNTLARGGAEEHILTLLNGMDANQFRLHLACHPEVAKKIRHDLPDHVELTPIHLRKPTHVSAAIQLAVLIRSRRIDILHSHLFYSSLFASPIGWLCRVPVILETPHLREHWRHGWIKSRFFIDRLAGRFVDKFIAVSEANARYLVEQKCLPKHKVVVIQNGCDIERFHPDLPAPTTLKHGLGFAKDDPVLMVIGRLEPQKGHRILLQAMPRILKEHPSVRLVCIGEGSLLEDLQNIADNLQISNSTRFVGYQSKTEDWLALADIVILPSFFEGLPLVAMESLAAERPIVATAVDGTPEIVINNKTGLTVPPEDDIALADAICSLLADPQKQKVLAKAGRQWVVDRFNKEGQINRTHELYVSALAKKHKYPFLSPLREESLGEGGK